MIKIRKFGQKSFRPEEFDFISTKDGNYLISTASNHEGYRFKSHYKSRGSWDSYDYWVFKIDQDGNKIWDRTFQANGEGR